MGDMDARLVVRCTVKITDKYVGWMRLDDGHQQPERAMKATRTIVGGRGRRDY